MVRHLLPFRAFMFTDSFRNPAMSSKLMATKDHVTQGMTAWLGMGIPLGFLPAGTIMPAINVGLVGWLTIAGKTFCLAAATIVDRRNTNRGV